MQPPSPATPSATACGLDFGTSNSTVGLVQAGQAVLLPLEDDRPTLPSAIFFHDDEPVVSHGRAALADYLAGYDGRLMRSMKSLLGSSLMEGHTEVRGRPLPFRSLLAHFIGELRRRAEHAAGQPLTRAVLGRPVFFVDDNPAADRLAEDTLAAIAREVGLTEIAFQYEPLAAAFAYEAGIEREELVLVVDVGGGTSDFTLIRLAPERRDQAERRDDILAHGGVHIGGVDFDRLASLATVMPLLGLGTELRSGKPVPSGPYIDLASWHTINNVYTRKAQAQLADVRREACEPDKVELLARLVERREGHWLAMQVEQAKIALSDADTTRIDLERLAPGAAVTLERAGFEAAIADLVGRVADTVSALLADAGLNGDTIDTVYFTGGSSRVPLLRQRIAALVPQARSVEGDVFGSIGTGLAIDAARRFA